MRYFCLACDYDGTIAHDSLCEPSTVKALQRVKASGRKLILATGRELDELLQVFPEASLFDRIVAENGAMLYRPSSKDHKLLAEPPPVEFVEELRRRGVRPLSVGKSTVATWHPFESDVLDFITAGSHGAGVEELIEKLLSDDLAGLAPRLKRHQILLGRTEQGKEFHLEPYGSKLIVAGPSGGGKSTTIAAIVERLIEARYQVCLFDPEGDYDEFDKFVTLGGPQRVPGASEILEVLNSRVHSLGINLLGVSLADRPAMFMSMLSRIQELRSFALVTVHPVQVARPILSSINGIIAIGPQPGEVIARFGAGAGKDLHRTALPDAPQGSGEVIVWQFSESAQPVKVTVEPAKAELRRHRRKYAAGELGEDKSFYFRGPEKKLNLRAHNMNMFAQLAEGVDEETWAHHLRNSDYSRWLRDSVKDTAIADEVAAIERNGALKSAESRTQIVDAIRKH